MATFRLKEWFLTITATNSRRGTRLRDGDRPTQSTFEDLLKSSVFKTEANDKAKVNDATKPLPEVVGHVALATDEEAKSNATQPQDRALAAQPSQITTAKGVEESDLNLSLDTISNDNQIDNPIVFDDTAIEVEDEGTTRNDYLIRFKESFRNFLSSLVETINDISLRLVAVIEQTETNRQDIETLVDLDGDVSAVINGIAPKGTIIQSVLGTGMNTDYWYKMDGGARLSKYNNDNVNDGPTSAWALFQNLTDIIVEDGLLFGFKNIGAPVFDSGLGLGERVTSGNDWKATFRQTDIPKHNHGSNLSTSIEGGHRHQYGTILGENDKNFTDAFAAGADRAFDSDRVPTRSWWTDEFNTPDESSPSGNPDKLVAINGQSKGGRRGFHKHNITGSISNYGSQTTTYPSVNVPRVGVNYYIKIK
jgi:hypothetical protein